VRKIVTAAFAFICATMSAHAQSLSTENVASRTIERRAIEAVIWGMPAVNFDLMYQATVQAKGSWNQIVYWSRLFGWENQTLTPNPGTIYFQPFYNTEEVGPMVLEIPPADESGSITGSVDDAWQTALEDVGPAGVDKGNGGKYLILPPGYKDPIPDGYIAMPSETYTGYALLRSNVRSGSDADVAKAVAYGKRIKFYPLSQAANPPETTFVDAINVVYDSTIPYDLRFFQSLNRAVQTEPWLTRDKAMIDTLKSIGIEKGKPFTPDASAQSLLTQAAKDAHAWLNAKYETVFSPPYFEGTHWALPALPEVIEGMSTDFANPDRYPVDGRGVTYSFAFFSAKHLGTGQYYLMTIKDKDGQSFDGGRGYRLHVPPDAPVTLYWSATVYDRATHALIRNVAVSSRASNTPGVQKNADGSIDIYFAPKAPEGKEANWVPTSADGEFEVLFRLYGPEKPLFDKTWRLPDIEKISAQAQGTAEGVQAQAAVQSPANSAIPVTVDNFIRAESDKYFSAVAITDGALGKFHHNREVEPVDHQNVIRANRDTLYSVAVFDLDAGPVTITLPDAGKRFMAMQVIDEDQYTPSATYRPGDYILTRKQVGTRYVMTAIRTLVDPADPKDVQKAHALQDAIKVSQKSPGKFEVPSWDRASQKKVRDALLVLAATVTDTRRAFGTKDQIDPVQRLVGAASAWGANPPKDATYLNFVPSRNDGVTIYKLHVKDVPVDGFWSVSVYNAEGYYQKNQYDAYTLNNVTATKSADGSVAIQFGGCGGKIANCLPTVPGWNYMVRLYRPHAEILNGKWKFPEAQPAN
jgi:hypothetical protein